MRVLIGFVLGAVAVWLLTRVEVSAVRQIPQTTIVYRDVPCEADRVIGL